MFDRRAASFGLNQFEVVVAVGLVRHFETAFGAGSCSVFDRICRKLMNDYCERGRGALADTYSGSRHASSIRKRGGFVIRGWQNRKKVPEQCGLALLLWQWAHAVESATKGGQV